VIFVGHIQGTFAHPKNSWDLRNCKQKHDAMVFEYIQRFSRKRNELPNVNDADVILTSLIFKGRFMKKLLLKRGYF